MCIPACQSQLTVKLPYRQLVVENYFPGEFLIHRKLVFTRQPACINKNLNLNPILRNTIVPNKLLGSGHVHYMTICVHCHCYVQKQTTTKTHDTNKSFIQIQDISHQLAISMLQKDQSCSCRQLIAEVLQSRRRPLLGTSPD